MKHPDSAFAQRLWKIFFEGRQTPGVFIECGANTGYEKCVCHWFEHAKGWSGINIEPNPHCYKELVKRRPECLNLQLALSDKEGSAIFKYPIDGPRKLLAGQGSLSPQRPKEWQRKNRQIWQIEIQTIRYCNLARLFVYFEPIDLMVLDVEGHELEVIRGMKGASNLPTVLCAEHVIVPQNKMLQLLGPMGYTIGGKDVHNTFFVRRS